MWQTKTVEENYLDSTAIIDPIKTMEWDQNNANGIQKF